MADTADWLQTLAPATRFILQGGTAARAAAGEAFGLRLPEEPCRASSVAGRSALWLGPDEQLLLAPVTEGQALGRDLSAALTGIPHSLVDVSHRQVAIRLSGPRASDMLNTGCPLDLDPLAFPPGSCTRTLLAKAEIVLWRKQAAEYHLEIARSYSGYVRDWLREAGQADFAE